MNMHKLELDILSSSSNTFHCSHLFWIYIKVVELVIKALIPGMTLSYSKLPCLIKFFEFGIHWWDFHTHSHCLTYPWILRLLLNHFVQSPNNMAYVVEVSTHYLKCTLLFNIKAISVTVPGKQFLSLAASSSDQVVQDIMNANTDFMEGLYETMIGLPLWKFFRTRGYRKLESSHEVIHR